MKEIEEGGSERERKKYQFVVPLIHAPLVNFCMCPDWGLNPQPWCIRMMLQPTELCGQDLFVDFFLIGETHYYLTKGVCRQNVPTDEFHGENGKKKKKMNLW